MRIGKLCLIFGLWLLACPLAARHSQAQSHEAPALREISEDELARGIAKTIQSLKPLRALIEVSESIQAQAWLVGGSAASVALYAKRQLQTTGVIPDDIHFFDVFSPGQDVDLALDGDLEAVRRLTVGITGRSELKAKMAEKSVWDVITLRPHNGRGFVANEDMFLQHSDTLSLGMIKLDRVATERATITWAPSFDLDAERNFDGSVENPFLKSVIDGRIDYLFRSTHENNSQFRAGKNPPILSVLRILNKAAKYSVSISDEDSEKLLEIVKEHLESSGTVFNDYVKGRVHRIVRQMIIGSGDSKYALHLLRKYKVLKVIRKVGVADAEMREIALLGRAMVQSRTGLFLGSYERVPVDKVIAMPDGSIFEGTNLYGGGRPPAMLFPSRLKDRPEVREAAEIWMNRKNLGAANVAGRLSSLASQLKSKSEVWNPNPPVVFLSDLPSVCRDCRDSAIIGHMLFTLAGIPSVISSDSAHTKVYIEIEDQKFRLNTHASNYDTVTHNAVGYIQNVWIRRGQRYEKPFTSAEAIMFDASLRDPNARFSKENLAEIFEHSPEKRTLFIESFRSHLADGSVLHIFDFELLREFFGDLQFEVEREVEVALTRLEMIDDLPLPGGFSRLKPVMAEVGIRLPETETMMRLLDLQMSRASAFADTNFRLQIIKNTAHWKSLVNRQVILTMMADKIDFSSTTLGPEIEELRKPSLELLPLARRIWIRNKLQLFNSSAGEFYRSSILPNALVLEFAKFDAYFNRLVHGGEVSQTAIQMLESTHAKALASSDAQHVIEFVQTLDFVTLKYRHYKVFTNEETEFSDWFKNFALTSPLLANESVKTVFLKVVEKQRDYLLQVAFAQKPAANLDRIWWLFDVDGMLSTSEHRQGSATIAELLVERALIESNGDESKLSLSVEKIMPLLRLVGQASSSGLMSVLSTTRHSIIKYLDPVTSLNLIKSIAGAPTLEQYRFVKEVIRAQGERLFAAAIQAELDETLKLLMSLAKADLDGSLNAKILNEYFDKLFSRTATQSSHQSVASSGIWKAFSRAQLALLDPSNVDRLFNGFADLNRKDKVSLFHHLSQNAYLNTETFAETHTSIFGGRIFKERSRGNTQLLRAILNNYEGQDKWIPRFIVDAVRTMMKSLDEKSVPADLYEQRLTQANELVERQLSSVPEITSDSMGDSKLAPKYTTDLCAKYLRKLL